MRIAIYARKSAFSEKSESVNNQDRMCREYAGFHFPGDHTFLNYTDEDFTGANTDRPALKKMLKDIKSGIIDKLIVYQLDRLSRDVRDFSNMYAELEACGVEFVSVKENIDTESPLGKAMMYICVVFAQMERETISNRVTDNMIGLAGAGWWTGGVLPRGYTSRRVSDGGKEHTMLVPDPEKAEELRGIFSEFVKLGQSAQRFTTYCRQNNIKIVPGKYLSEGQVHKILRAPYGAPACPETRQFFVDSGATVLGSEKDWDGTCGIMIYGRTRQSKGYSRSPAENWRVCVGKHEPIFSAELWLAAQSQLTSNIYTKKTKYPTQLLKGSLRCPCGRLMKISRYKKRSGGYNAYYTCSRLQSTGKSPDCVSQINANMLDRKALDIFRQIERDPDMINRCSPVLCDADPTAVKKKEGEIKRLEDKIGNLSAALAESSGSAAAKYIIAEIEKIDAQIADKKMQLAGLQANALAADRAAAELAAKQKEIAHLVRNLEDLDIEEQNKIARSVLKKCVWDGESLFLTF